MAGMGMDLVGAVVHNHVIMEHVLGRLDPTSRLEARLVCSDWNAAALGHVRSLFFLFDATEGSRKDAPIAAGLLSQVQHRARSRRRAVEVTLMLSPMAEEAAAFVHFKEVELYLRTGAPMWNQSNEELAAMYAQTQQCLPTEIAGFLTTLFGVPSSFLVQLRLEVRLGEEEEDARLLRRILSEALVSLRKLAIEIVAWKEGSVLTFQGPEAWAEMRGLETLSVGFSLSSRSVDHEPPQVLFTHLLSQLLCPSVKFLDAVSYRHSFNAVCHVPQWLESARAVLSKDDYPPSNLAGFKGLVYETQHVILSQLSAFFPVRLTHLNLRIMTMDGSRRKDGLERILKAHSSTLVHLDISFPAWGEDDKVPEGDPLRGQVTLPRLPNLQTLCFAHDGWSGGDEEGSWSWRHLDGLGLESVLAVRRFPLWTLRQNDMTTYCTFFKGGSNQAQSITLLSFSIIRPFGYVEGEGCESGCPLRSVPTVFPNLSVLTHLQVQTGCGGQDEDEEEVRVCSHKYYDQLKGWPGFGKRPQIKIYII